MHPGRRVAKANGDILRMPCTILSIVVGAIGVLACLLVGCVMIGMTVRLSECSRTAENKNGEARSGDLFHRGLLVQRCEHSNALTDLSKRKRVMVLSVSLMPRF